MKSVIQKIKSIISICVAGSIFTFSIVHPVTAQQTFRNPLDIPLLLSANFAEIRPDHFHTGFDIRTQEKTGFKVFAAADGYVSRIKVSAFGFGNAVYIMHPNGYMTVYGHLDHFSDSIAAYVKQSQYEKQSFEVDLFPDARKFPVKQGTLIAYSGNSGSSGGPHLHFEIRDASGESYPLDPTPFLKPDDTIAPKFNALFIYSPAAQETLPVKYTVSKKSSGYTTTADSLTVNNAFIGVGIDASDFMNHTANNYGLYNISMTIDGRQIYSVKFDRLDFNNGRYVNAYTDYAEKKRSGKIIQRLFRLPGDHNTTYDTLLNDGKIVLKDTLFHAIRITVKDASGNSAVLQFHLKFSGKENKPAPVASGKLFKYNQPNSFSTDSIRITLPANILYSDLDFRYSESPATGNRIFSAIHHVHNGYIPVHSAYDISILPKNIPPALKSKAVIVYENEKGGRSSKTSHWDGNWLSAKARDFGDFYVMLDTVAPKITPVGIRQNQLLTTNKISFTIADNLSGIVSYKGMLDGKWILMEYDAKNDRLSCTIDGTVSAGEHSLKVTVTDDVKNEGSYVLKFKK